MKRSVLSRLYCIGVYVILAFSPALAQSTGEQSYIFPGVTRDMDIAIGNINTQSVGVSVAFYRTSGDVISSSFVLESGKQTRLNPTSAGITDFSGSVIITLRASPDSFRESLQRGHPL